MKRKIIILTAISALSLAIPLSLSLIRPLSKEVNAYSGSSLPTTINLNDTSEENIRSYYSSLNNLDIEERQGTNLLKNLKTILKNNQKYYSYDSGNLVWHMYEITDRDWEKSPANEITHGTYNPSTKIITNYQYNTENPYVRSLYTNRDVDNEAKAYGDHSQSNWGINREHLWPKAEGFDTSGAGGARGDPMHLQAGNGYANNIHSNYYYGFVNTNKDYTNCGSKYSYLDGNLRGDSLTISSDTSHLVFEAQDSDKGDIARAIFYMVARYNYLSGSDEDGIDSNNPNLTLTQDLSDWSQSGYTSTKTNPGKLGILTDLLEWHKLDPVDEYEIHRNNLLYVNFTNNRNPFIDFPEWVDYIWGTALYEGNKYQSYSSTPTGYATPSSDRVNGYNGGETTVSVTGVSLSNSELTLSINDSETLVATVSPFNATNKNVTWSSSDSSTVSVTNGLVKGLKEGTATILVRTEDGGFTDTCLVTVTNESSTETLDTLTASDLAATSTTYTHFEGVKKNNAVYAGETAKSNEAIQMNTSKGIVSTVSGGRVKSVTVTFNNNTSSAATLGIYARNTDFTSDFALNTIKDNSTLVETFEKAAGLTQKYTFTDSYTAIAIQPRKNANYLDSISIEWTTEEIDVVNVTGVSLDYSEYSIYLDESFSLSATISPDNATNKDISWTSSDESIATVNGGLVTGVGLGEATITVTTSDGGFSASCLVNVEAYHVTNVELNVNEASLELHETLQLEATITPDNATDPSVTWSSSNDMVATVDNDGFVTPVNPGQATIRVTTTDGGLTDTCIVTVLPYSVTGVSLNETSAELNIDDTLQLAATVTPEYATNKNVTWESEKEGVATVDSNGLVTAIAKGTTTITVTTVDGGFTATCVVTVLSSSVSEVIDVLDQPGIGIAGTTYTSWNSKSFSSNAIYAGHTAGGYESIQMRTSDNKSGIVTTSSGGFVKSITINWNDSTASTRTIDVYGKNTAYSSSADLYNNDNKGTEIASFTRGTKMTETINISGEYAFIGLRSYSGAIWVTSIEITWEVPSETIAVTGVSLDKENMELDEGDTGSLVATIAPIDATNKNVLWESSDELVATVDNGQVTAVSEGTATITVTTVDGGFVDTCEVTVNGSVGPVVVDGVYSKFELVRDVNDLKDGDTIIIVNNEKNVALSATQNSNNRGQEAVTIDNESITYDKQEDKLGRIVLIKSGVNWNLKVDGGYLYAASSSGNQLKTETQLDPNNDGLWSISIDNDEVASIVAQGSNTRNTMRYNSSSEIFSCYAPANTQKDVVIYKSYESEVDNYWANAFLNENTSGCDKYGKSSTIDWTSSKTNYNALTTKAKAVLENGAATESKDALLYKQALARYDYIVQKYGTSIYENYIQRNVNSAGRINNTYDFNSNNTNGVLIVVSIFALASTLSLIIIKQKRRNK